MIKPATTISVVPNLPEPLLRLKELAYNLRWAWDNDTISLFRRLDAELWSETGHNPVRMLGLVSQARLQAAAEDPAFMAHLRQVTAAFDAYMNASDTWFAQHTEDADQPTIAYFSMEFGLTDCLQNYSGGLGVLSGDHLKSASDLGLPLVGVGLLYQEGYFQQYLNADGYQQESYPLNDYANLPVKLQHDAEGRPIKISVPLPGRELYAVIWKVQVGRVPLYLLDANIPDNRRREDRNLTDRLYGGDRRTRIRQEILMGIGGIRALDALGLRPTVCHMNEGHSAFLALERIRQLMHTQELTFQQAREITAAGNIFTTHTPVPAGLERYGFDLMDEHFTEYYKELGLPREAFLDLGREHIDGRDVFSMAVLALKVSSGANGVAGLHGEVSRRMWHWMYPNVPEHEIPISHITNGIHVQSWINQDMVTLLDRYLDPAWRSEESRPEIWENVGAIPDGELWRAHARRRERLVTFTRTRLQNQLKRRGAPQTDLEVAAEALNPEALTIGFARRFATYKRATLLLHDLERLSRIVNAAERPVQFVFAGKAHPHDQEGKEFIRQIVNVARREEFRHALVFLENYDMNMARYLVQGVDVWMNNPRRPKEASGTSGMKVIYNGGLNFSILDGWWAEAYHPSLGWAIGNGEEYPEHEAGLQDDVESRALYNVLEQDIIPLFYNRGRDGIPHEWLAKVKASMAALSPFFNTRRMVQAYARELYLPGHQRARAIDANGGQNYAAWRSRIEQLWGQIQVIRVDVPEAEIRIGDQIEVKAVVELGALTPDDVTVQLYYGPLDSHGELNAGGHALDMALFNEDGEGRYVFCTHFAETRTGDRGLSVRVLPRHKYLSNPFHLSLVTWA